MVRSRNNRVVMSQRDVRQTNQSEPGPSSTSATASLHQHHNHHHHLPSTIFCTWCRNDGRHFSCLCEWAQPADLDSDSSYLVPTQDWTKSSMSSEGWVPASGPCCEDCLEAAFERKRRCDMAEGQGGGGGILGGGYLLGQARNWCCDRGQHACLSLQRGWLHLRSWVERAAKVRRAQWWGGGGGGGGGGEDSSNSSEADRWCDVQFEGEGFLEVKVVVSRRGAMQHLEVDFPLDVPVALLKHELATLIHCPVEQQRWFYKGLPMDERKTLEQIDVEIGSILEVKCQN